MRMNLGHPLKRNIPNERDARPKYAHILSAFANAHSNCKAGKVHRQSAARIFLSILHAE